MNDKFNPKYTITVPLIMISIFILNYVIKMDSYSIWNLWEICLLFFSVLLIVAAYIKPYKEFNNKPE